MLSFVLLCLDDQTTVQHTPTSTGGLTDSITETSTSGLTGGITETSNYC